MIVEMKKITVLVLKKDRDDALARLRDLGVVHVHAVKTPATGEIPEIEAEIARVERALELVGATEDLPGEATAAKERVDEILALAQQRDDLRRELAEHRESSRWFDEWDDVSRATWQQLRDAGVVVRFYKADRAALQTLPADHVVQVLKESDGLVYLLHVAQDADSRLELLEDPMPPVEIASVRARMDEIEAKVTGIDAALQALSSTAGDLSAYRTQLAQRLEYHQVREGMGQEGDIAYLQGFCPAQDVEAIARLAAEAGWGYSSETPDDPGEVPTLLQTSRWVRIIQPVFDFMGTLPGYQEFDVSAWFLVFFGLFYAMLVGDGGYGLVFLGATIYARRKARMAPAEPFVLMYVLSVATIFWGTITGTWFGMESIFQIPGLAFLKDLTIAPLRSIDGDPEFMMYVCFVIGAVQLSIAHGLIGLRQIKSPVAIAQLGWIGIVWSLFFVACKFVLYRPLPDFVLPLLFGSLGLVLVFANFQKNLLKGMGITMGDLPLSVIGAFSDVVSYLRLFAVGFATFVVASSFNGMAAAAGPGLLGGLTAAVILFLGHSLNIILAIMAVVVHGIRLNMLEFSGHLNMQWSGKPYQPFRISSAE